MRLARWEVPGEAGLADLGVGRLTTHRARDAIVFARESLRDVRTYLEQARRFGRR